MSLIIDIIQGLGGILLGVINIYIWVIIIAALLSFVNPDPYNPIVQFLHRITEPAYRLVRRYIRTDFGGLDLAPLIIIIALQVVIVILSSVLRSLY
ncbi:YggT family protein [Sulfurimonas lithotrophica]|uniref:YggT family protein n=1 Tax=Sulfurimonas lithotrophica TaxID=2590022 RepID=A0A5P8P101_9BACT|nr:YggT family protein [Sulfurimonas lithotrophica]QFR49290.1 YggT family protein [Sulfurimonas lithotrophica]